MVDGILHLKINGEPVYLKGGNWGMSEYMLRCRGEEYDLKVIRIPNNEIAQNFRGVCEYIDSVVKQRLKAPLGHKGSCQQS